LADLDAAVRAAVAFVDQPGDDIDWTNTVLVVTADHATGGLRLNPSKPLGAGALPLQVARPKQGPGSGAEEAEAVPNAKPVLRAAPKSPFSYPDGEVSYSTIGHTNELVTLAVSGPAARLFLIYQGSWYPGPIVDNTQVNAAMREALGLGVIKKAPVAIDNVTASPGSPGRAARK
jgi:alkaline phosphatase